MSARVVEPQVHCVEEADCGELDARPVIVRSARDMNVSACDLPARWTERVGQENEPRLGQADHSISRFQLLEGKRPKGQISFETMVFKDRRTAAEVLVGTLSRLPFHKMSRIDLGDAGAMIELIGKPGRTMRTIAFVKNNVCGLIMLTCEHDSGVTDLWLVSMARLMASRMP
jgi:hypothetical protein